MPSHKISAMQRTLFAVKDHLAIQKDPALAELAEKGADLAGLARLACSEDARLRAQLSAKLNELGLTTLGARKRAEKALRGESLTDAIGVAAEGDGEAEAAEAAEAQEAEEELPPAPPPLSAEEQLERRAERERLFEAKVLEGYAGRAEAGRRRAEAAARDPSERAPVIGVADDDDASVDTSAGRQLFEAALAGKLELVETLLRDHGQPVGGTDSDSHSAAAAAPGGGAADDGTPFLSWVNKWTESALHIAADRGHAAIVRRLLRAGAEVNARNQWNCTPLMAAAYWGHAPCVEALLLAGADPRVVADNGKTARTVARQAEHLACLRLLKSAPKGNFPPSAESLAAEAEDGGEEDVDTEPETSNMPRDMIVWCEEHLARMTPGARAHNTHTTRTQHARLLRAPQVDHSPLHACARASPLRSRCVLSTHCCDLRRRQAHVPPALALLPAHLRGP